MHLRKVLNATLRRLGYQLVKIDRFREILQEEYERAGEFRFVQIGANDGVSHDLLYEFATNPKSKGIAVEPLPTYFTLLEENYRLFPSIKPVQCAVHPTEKTATMYYVDPARESEVPNFAKGIGSFDPEHATRLGVSKDVMITGEVECRPLMELVRENELGDALLLQIDTEGFDTEGFDYEVLKMIDFSEFSPPLIKYEHENLKRADQAAAESLLRENGYEVQKIKTDTVGIREKRS